MYIMFNICHTHSTHTHQLEEGIYMFQPVSFTNCKISKLHHLTQLWWLEDEFPFGIAYS